MIIITLANNSSRRSRTKAHLIGLPRQTHPEKPREVWDNKTVYNVTNCLSTHPQPRVRPIIRTIIGDRIHHKPSFRYIHSLAMTHKTTMLNRSQLDVVSLDPRTGRPVFSTANHFTLIFGNRLCGCVRLERRLETRNIRFTARDSARILVRTFGT